LIYLNSIQLKENDRTVKVYAIKKQRGINIIHPILWSILWLDKIRKMQDINIPKSIHIDKYNSKER
jgi:hypothetical protein